MSSLAVAWGIALIVTLGTLPVGIIRMVAYRSGEIDHTRTMRIAAAFALTVGGAGLIALIALSAILLGR